MRFLIIISTLVSLFACQSSVNTEQVSVSNQSYVKNKVAYQKQGAALVLVNSQVNLEETETEYAIDLSIFSQYNSGNLTLTVAASEGLELIEGDTTVEQPLSKGTLVFPYTVSAAEAGHYYLKAQAQVVDANGKKSLRALALIVEVGEGKGYTKNKSVEEKTSKTTVEKTTTFGDPVILQMTEEIITK